MRLRRGQRVNLWYRYPLDPVPRPVSTRILHDGCSIADAISRSIGRDYGIQSVVDSPTPTMDLLGLLEQFPDPDVLYALSYASIRPPSFFPDRRVSRKRRWCEEDDDFAARSVVTRLV